MEVSNCTIPISSRFPDEEAEEFSMWLVWWSESTQMRGRRCFSLYRACAEVKGQVLCHEEGGGGPAEGWTTTETEIL